MKKIALFILILAYSVTVSAEYTTETTTRNPLLQLFSELSQTPAPEYNIHNDSDKLFNWAEIRYPDLFSPPEQESQTFEQWYYRYYPNTKNYVGVSTDHEVWVLGDVFGGMKRIDTLESLLFSMTCKEDSYNCPSCNNYQTLNYNPDGSGYCVTTSCPVGENLVNGKCMDKGCDGLYPQDGDYRYECTKDGDRLTVVRYFKGSETDRKEYEGGQFKRYNSKICYPDQPSEHPCYSQIIVIEDTGKDYLFNRINEQGIYIRVQRTLNKYRLSVNDRNSNSDTTTSAYLLANGEYDINRFSYQTYTGFLNILEKVDSKECFNDPKIRFHKSYSEDYFDYIACREGLFKKGVDLLNTYNKEYSIPVW